MGSRVGFRGFRRASAPLGFAPEAIDTELAEELEMGAELISGHDQREASLAGTRPEEVLDTVEDDRRDAGLALERHHLFVAVADDRHGIRVGVEPLIRLRHVVRDDEIDLLAGALLARPGDEVLRFGGESDEDRALAAEAGPHRSEVAQNVLRPLQRERQRTVGLGHLLRGRRRRRVVGDGGRHDDDIRVRRRAHHRLVHVGGTPNRDRRVHAGR